jgi:ferredoxin
LVGVFLKMARLVCQKGFSVTKIVVDLEKCRGTGACALACPHNAISILDGVAAVDETKCDLDGICIPACPHHAIHFTEDERP